MPIGILPSDIELKIADIAASLASWVVVSHIHPFPSTPNLAYPSSMLVNHDALFSLRTSISPRPPPVFRPQPPFFFLSSIISTLSSGTLPTSVIQSKISSLLSPCTTTSSAPPEGDGCQQVSLRCPSASLALCPHLDSPFYYSIPMPHLPPHSFQN